MARLFAGIREMNFISDLTKEIIKDVNGQQIHVHPISEFNTKTHDVYQESIKKVFENPIKIDALVDTQVQKQSKVSSFGVDKQYTIDVFIQYRDLIDKGINIAIGDYFSFSDIFYEIIDVTTIKSIFGQAENKDGVKVTGTKARAEQIDALLLGPTDIKYTDPDAVQKKFVQQRGEASNSEGLTGDKRELIESGVLDRALEGPMEVSEKGAQSDNSNYGSAFYDEKP